MHPNKRNFVEGLHIILKRWTALQLAVDMDLGGPNTAQKAEDLHYSLVDYVEKGIDFTYCESYNLYSEAKNIEPEDLEDILFDVLKDEFGILLEDSSEVEVPLTTCAYFILIHK